MLCTYHFILDHRVGGPHVYVDTLREALSGKVESVMVTTGCGPMTELSLPNLRHLWAPLYTLELVVNMLLLTVSVLVGRVRRENVVFTVHGGANLAPLMAARLVGIPVVWIFHETTPRFRGLVKLGRWVLEGGAYALAVVAERSREVYDLDDAVYLPAAVVPSFWSLNQVSQGEWDACGWSESSSNSLPPLRFLAVGNLNPLKGIDVLLDSLADIEGPWHLKIIGAPLETHQDYEAALHRRAVEITQRDHHSQIEFLGWQDKEKVRSLMATCDVFVLPSRSEACPIALLEAMSMGCRCIAADVGDVRLMLAGYLDGEIFPAESVVACREAILEIQAQQYGSPHERTSSFGNAWRLPIVSTKVEALYRSLLKLDQGCF
jgi:glycosyltransferase involved in cell wall biosynthesis